MFYGAVIFGLFQRLIFVIAFSHMFQARFFCAILCFRHFSFDTNIALSISRADSAFAIFLFDIFIGCIVADESFHALRID